MHTDDDKTFTPQRLVILVTAVIWIVFACGLPLQSAREARRQAHLQLTQVLAAGKLDTANVTAAFDRATQDVIAAATLPCLSLAVCVIFLIHQMLKLKRRYNALTLELRTCQNQALPLTDEPMNPE